MDVVAASNVVRYFPISIRNGNDSAYGRRFRARDASLRGMSNRQARPTGIAFTGWSSERFALTQPRSLRLAGIAAVASMLGVAGGLAGCASPAPPKPPTLNLPALATDILAQRMG